MRTMILLLATAVFVSASALVSGPAQALASGGGFGFQRVVSPKDSFERPSCTRQRVCAPDGCVWRTISR